MKIMFGGEPRPVVSDRLESVRVSHNDWSYESSSYCPHGEARTGSGPMFATYPRSMNTNLHYAQNRWYSSQIGRFTTPDPYGASASLANPQSWNRYAYVENDPVNKNDPSGLDPVTQVLTPGTGYCPPSMGSCFWIPTPGAFNPYGIVAPGIGAVETGSALGGISPDMAEGVSRYMIGTGHACVSWSSAGSESNQW